MSGTLLSVGDTEVKRVIFVPKAIRIWKKGEYICTQRCGKIHGSTREGPGRQRILVSS